MDKPLEDVASTFHGALAGLHGFAVLFFGRRALREYNAFRPVGRLSLWLAFHAAACVVSVFASRIHARDARR